MDRGWRVAPTSSSGGRFASQASYRAVGRDAVGREDLRRAAVVLARAPGTTRRRSERENIPAAGRALIDPPRQALLSSGTFPERAETTTFPFFPAFGPAHHQRAICDFYSPGQCDIVFGSLRDVASLCDFQKPRRVLNSQGFDGLPPEMLSVPAKSPRREGRLSFLCSLGVHTHRREPPPKRE